MIDDIFLFIVWPFLFSLIPTLVICWIYGIVLLVNRKDVTDKAIREGHVVQARLVRKQYVIERDPGNQGFNRCRYEYTYKGKTYHRTWRYDAVYGRPPEYQELYFRRFPLDAGDLDDITKPGKVTSFIIFVIVFCLVSVWFRLTGFGM